MQILFSIAYIGFMIGTILEIKKVAGTWSHVTDCVKNAFFFSLLIFLALFRYQIDLAGILELWPIAYSFSLMGVFISKHKKDIISQLGEGITLLHSMAIYYYFVEYYFNPEIQLSVNWLIVLTFPLSFSIYQVFSYREIGQKSRLGLSLWSSLIMIFFGIVYAKNVFIINHTISNFEDSGFLDSMVLFFEFLLFGAGGPYILQNVLSLMFYIPGEKELFLEEYHQRIRKLNQDHVERYSPEQIRRRDGLFAFIFAFTIFAINFKLKLVAPSSAVWFCIIVIPIIMKFIFRKNMLWNETKRKVF